MNDKNKQFAEEMQRVRPVTRSLIESALSGEDPTPGAIVDFGIDSPAHLYALIQPIREDEISPAELDAALGNGASLTALAGAAPSNRHLQVEFFTSYDVIFGRRRFSQQPAKGEHLPDDNNTGDLARHDGVIDRDDGPER